MSRILTLEDFYHNLVEEINLAADVNVTGWNIDDFLTSTMLEYLEDAGETDSPIICPFRSPGLQMNAYAFSLDYTSLELYVCIYADSVLPKQVPQSAIDSAIKRAVQVYHKAINDLHKSFQKDNDTYEFAVTVLNKHKKIKNVSVCALTNGLVKPINLNNIVIGDTTISFRIWDVERLYKCVTSGKMRETIEIDFEEKYGITIPCIENITSEKYKVYLAIISGNILSKLYGEYRDRLLERNVRSFLQVRGAVNRGIRETLRNEPEMFLAYNNGISVTAENVVLVRDSNGKPSIKKIKDMQIVNGGQTTASIFNAFKESKNPDSLKNVYVQMKVSAIPSSELADEIVPRISAFANTQNRIQMADFSSNDPFHRRVEELSRTIWTTAIGGQKPKNWFYERARGQYIDMLSKETTSLRKREFKATHPLFTKTDLAKYENTWDQMPHVVSEGAQKNFRKFMIRLGERKLPLPDALYYQRLIAKAILFRRTEQLVQEQKFGGYRANIVTYTIALISHKTAQRINLEQIWQTQSLSSALEDEIVTLSHEVRNIIVNPPGGANISEWCKREKCWEAVKALDCKISPLLEKELLSLERTNSAHSTPIASVDSITPEEQTIIDKVSSISASTWVAMSKWAKETGNLQSWQRSILFSVGSVLNRGKTPSIKQSKQAQIAYDEAVSKGFCA